MELLTHGDVHNYNTRKNVFNLFFKYKIIENITLQTASKLYHPKKNIASNDGNLFPEPLYSFRINI